MEGTLYSTHLLKGFEIGATDGSIGKCSDFLVDDEAWVIRYLVVNTRNWLLGRKVLVSPISVADIDLVAQLVNLELTKKQIKNSPLLDLNAPVSRQYEILFNQYYDWPDYWDGSEFWGQEPHPRSRKSKKRLLEIENSDKGKSNLRSAKEIAGYRVHGRDGEIGYVKDFLIAKESWQIRYLVVDTSKWIPSRMSIVIHPNWIESVNWADNSLLIMMTKEQIESSPEYDSKIPVHRNYEKSIFDHFKFPYYW